MIEGKITFDRAVRWLITGAAVTAGYFILKYLSPVLLPFALGWLLAYLTYPLVKLLQYRVGLRWRTLSILVAMTLVAAVVAGVMMLVVPPLMEEFARFSRYASTRLHSIANQQLDGPFEEWLHECAAEITQFMQSDKFADALENAMPELFTLMNRTLSAILRFLESGIALLYMFFILKDYEYLAGSWTHIFPVKSRGFWEELLHDVKLTLDNYLRGQGTVALIMAVLFAIGFYIIDFPMGIALAILIGILDMVPYLHTLALLPAAFLSVMKAADTGESFWAIFGGAVVVFCVVQLIVEAFVIPKVMGKKMRMNPAVLLLSLSIWGALLGFTGLIIALPATSVLQIYWKKYVTHNS